MLKKNNNKQWIVSFNANFRAFIRPFSYGPKGFISKDNYLVKSYLSEYDSPISNKNFMINSKFSNIDIFSKETEDE